MGVYKKAIITEAGEALAARAVSGEATVQFSHAKTSAHIYADGTNLKKLTDLEEIKQVVIPSNIQVVNNTLVSIRSMFDNNEITQEYLIQNVGIYASDGEKEILFAICQAATPDQMPAFNGVAPSSFIYNVQIGIAQADQLSISVNTAGAAMVQDVLDLERKIEEKKVDSVGGDTADTLVSAFDVSSDSFPVPAEREKARTRWGKMKKFAEDFKKWMAGISNEVEVTLPASGWSGSAPYTQTVAVPGLKSTDKIKLMSAVKKDTPAETVQTWEKMSGMIKAGEALNGQAVFYCPLKKPTKDFKIKLVGVSINV